LNQTNNNNVSLADAFERHEQEVIANEQGAPRSNFIQPQYFNQVQQPQPQYFNQVQQPQPQYFNQVQQPQPQYFNQVQQPQPQYFNQVQQPQQQNSNETIPFFTIPKGAKG
jgi:hypothetical protein